MKSLNVGRPRSAGRLDLPDYLTPRPRKVKGRVVVYWFWYDIRIDKEVSLECPDNRDTAIKRAKRLNAMVAQELADQLVTNLAAGARRTGAASMPFGVYAAHYLKLIKTRGYADTTLRSRKSAINAAIRWFKNRPMQEISHDVPAVVAFLESYNEQDKKRMAQTLRSALMDVWKEAYQEGVLKADEHPNPAEIARRPEAKVKQARLTLETFNSVFAASEKLAEARGAWIPNSQLLGLVTGQRREDLAIAQFRRGRDWIKLWQEYQDDPDNCKAHPYPHVHDGYFWVIQQKTGAMVQIPLDLRLDVIGLSVGDVIERCRSKVASRFLLHHTVAFGNAPLGSPIHVDSISHAFADSRVEAGIIWPEKKTPPTYRELRSLSERLYKKQGIDTQALLGHKHASMTEVYDDPRQAEWVTVAS